jgi:iron complex transport system permease protein
MSVQEESFLNMASASPSITPGGAVRRRAFYIVFSLSLLAVASIGFACMVGSVALPPADLATAMMEIAKGDPTSLAASLLELRLERALSAFVTGSALALAGVMMQVLLRNPLADPYVLGVSGGASVGALLAMLFMGAAWMIDAAAFGGAVLVAVLLYWLARRDLRGNMAAEGSSQLLLTGVILASGCGALVTLVLSIAPDSRLRSMVFWLVGDLSGSQSGWLPWSVLAVAFAFALCTARSINLVAMQSQAAATLGVRVGALRKALFLCSAILTATAVTGAGSIGFVGLVVPHACRFAFGPDHRLLLPASAIGGGVFLVMADTLARVVLAPQQLPVGVVTAMIGVPVFLFQLYRFHRH